jgi:hypothetical protein
MERLPLQVQHAARATCHSADHAGAGSDRYQDICDISLLYAHHLTEVFLKLSL